MYWQWDPFNTIRYLENYLSREKLPYMFSLKHTLKFLRGHFLTACISKFCWNIISCFIKEDFASRITWIEMQNFSLYSKMLSQFLETTKPSCYCETNCYSVSVSVVSFQLLFLLLIFYLQFYFWRILDFQYFITISLAMQQISSWVSHSNTKYS